MHNTLHPNSQRGLPRLLTFLPHRTRGKRLTCCPTDNTNLNPARRPVREPHRLLQLLATDNISHETCVTGLASLSHFVALVAKCDVQQATLPPIGAATFFAAQSCYGKNKIFTCRLGTSPPLHRGPTLSCSPRMPKLPLSVPKSE